MHGAKIHIREYNCEERTYHQPLKHSITHHQPLLLASYYFLAILAVHSLVNTPLEDRPSTDKVWLKRYPHSAPLSSSFKYKEWTIMTKLTPRDSRRAQSS